MKLLNNRIAEEKAKQEQGAVFLEFLLVFGTFVMLFLFFLDVMHFMAARAVLLKGAQDGLAVAVVHEGIQKDLDSESIGSLAHQEYIQGLEDVDAAAIRVPLNSMITNPDTQEDGLVLLKRVKLKTTVGGSEWPESSSNQEFKTLLLRPGDSANFSDTAFLNNGTATDDFAHPDLKDADESIEKALKSKPIIVSLSAEKKMFTPFFGNLPIKVAAVGWVQQFPKAGYNVAALGDDGGPGDPDPGACRQENHPSCTNWIEDQCRCCDARNCNGGNWSPDQCGCDCSEALASCPPGYTQISSWDCRCKPCPNITCDSNGQNCTCPDNQETIGQ